MDWDDLPTEELFSRFLQLEENLRQKNEQIDKQSELIEQQNELIEQQRERIEELEARLRKYENPYTPPSKQRSTTAESSTSQDNEDDEDDLRTDGGTPGRNDGHDPEATEQRGRKPLREPVFHSSLAH